MLRRVGCALFSSSRTSLSKAQKEIVCGSNPFVNCKLSFLGLVGKRRIQLSCSIKWTKAKVKKCETVKLAKCHIYGTLLSNF